MKGSSQVAQIGGSLSKFDVTPYPEVGATAKASILKEVEAADSQRHHSTRSEVWNNDRKKAVNFEGG
jgi:hypothetical protein